MAVSPAQSSIVRQSVGVALLTCGTILTMYGGWLLRGVFGSPFGHPVANAALPFLLLALPLFAVYALLERRNFALSRWLGLPVGPRESWLVSAAAFAVLGVFWVFVKGSMGYRAAAKADAAVAKPVSNEPPPLRAPGREFVETVVFVVVLVSMLNLFVVQAFVIPTGSMAETLYGYNKVITCPECGHTFAVDASHEADPQGGREYQRINGYCCPNCRYDNPTGAATINWTSGDRVLVGKFLSMDDRGRVVVFKFPDAPQTGQVAQNYIKRLVGLPGETIAVCGGDLYVTRALTYPADAVGADGNPLYPRPKDPNLLWRAPFEDRSGVRWDGDDYGYANAAEALALFDRSRTAGFTPGANGFEVVRKPDDLVMSERRIVYDNDHQTPYLTQAGNRPRWEADPDAGSGWTADDPNGPRAFTHTGDGLGWVRYQHLLPADGRPGWGRTGTVKLAPRRITNFQGYNAGHQGTEGQERLKDGSDHWVGDLMVECRVKADDGAAVVLEVAKGEYRYRAEFVGGQVRLKMFPDADGEPRKGPDGLTRTGPRVVPVGEDTFTLTTAAAPLKPGTGYDLRFANVDSRLRVWVDDVPVDFAGKGDYAPPQPPTTFLPEDAAREGWTRADIDRPVRVGASGGAQVKGLKVWRDTYYTQSRGPNNKRHTGERNDVSTYYVQPGHYLCMGDNSSQSSDGRMWGLVPERLMLGRAVFIFWPIERIGFIK